MKIVGIVPVFLAVGASSFLLFFLISPIAVSAEAVPMCPFSWSTTLKAGSIGNDVLKLQQFLNTDPATTIANSESGSVGMETTHFGQLTKQAVITFQEKYASDILTPNGLSKGTGVVGASTRAKLNALCTGVTPQVSQTAPSVPSNTLTLTAVEQPIGSLALSGALYVPFTRVTLTAGSEDVTVSRITIERIGPSVDINFANADLLLDEDSSFVGVAYFNSNHQATFKKPFTILKGESKTITIAGDMAADLTGHEGEIAGMKIVSIEATSPITGSLPITGTFHTMNSSLLIGAVTARLSSDDPRGDRTRFINDTGIIFSGVRITADSHEAIRLDSITWEQTGTAGSSDFTNIATIVNGVSYPATNNKRFYTSVFEEPIIIQKGNSLDIAIKGDITTSGSNRTVKFDINDAADINITGISYGFGIYTTPEDPIGTSGNSTFLTVDGTADTDSITPFFSGSQVTISGGAVTGISKN
ncbi:peptidoglycan-binding protein [Patescibacteria group bacterium]|nr:MAG: peptidoglycan-binding protein [Patescibacteria group bacterium]